MHTSIFTLHIHTAHLTIHTSSFIKWTLPKA